MLKETYRNLNNNIKPDDALICQVLNGARAVPKKRYKLVLIPVLILAALLAVAPVLAAVPSVNALLYQISPQTAQFFKPVQLSCEDNGIKMEVESAYIHDNTAEIFISFQDLTGNRIDATSDLNDSYSILRPFDSSASCQFAGFDETSKTARFLITITVWGNRQIAGDKITFRVRYILSHKKEWEDIPIPFSQRMANPAPAVRQVSRTGYSGSGMADKNTDAMTALEPSSPMTFPVEGILFTGAAFLDNQLHLQIAAEDNLTKDNHGYFYLKDTNGERLSYESSFFFMEYAADGTRMDYNEFVFDLSPEEVDRYNLYGTFFTSNGYTEGDWQVTFPLQENKCKE